MTRESIYQRALGVDFERLHPQIQRRFGFSSRDGVACVGRGVMEEVWHGRPYTLPFLYVGTWRRIMFPEYGRNVALRFPLFFSGVADVHEWYDDKAQLFRIDVRVSNSRWGPLFGYRGHFQVEWRALKAEELPTDIRPQRVEPRE